MIPIADDPFGNAICLGVRGKIFGIVFFWDHEASDAEPECIAGSFTELVKNLREE